MDICGHNFRSSESPNASDTAESKYSRYTKFRNFHPFSTRENNKHYNMKIYALAENFSTTSTINARGIYPRQFWTGAGSCLIYLVPDRTTINRPWMVGNSRYYSQLCALGPVVLKVGLHREKKYKMNYNFIFKRSSNTSDSRKLGVCTTSAGAPKNVSKAALLQDYSHSN